MILTFGLYKCHESSMDQLYLEVILQFWELLKPLGFYKLNYLHDCIFSKYVF